MSAYLESLVGQRVRLVGKHPHAGEEGTGERMAGTAFGASGLVVKLHNCPHWTDGCFVFEDRHVVAIGAGHRERRRRR